MILYVIWNFLAVIGCISLLFGLCIISWISVDQLHIKKEQKKKG